MLKNKFNSKIITVGDGLLKYILIKLIKLYQKLPLHSHIKCRFIPTCSNYALSVINEFGSIKGSYLAIKRIIKCNPFHEPGIDLPPKKGDKNEKN